MWSFVSCSLSVGPGKFAGHRPLTFYHCATQPTGKGKTAETSERRCTNVNVERVPTLPPVGGRSIVISASVCFSLYLTVCLSAGVSENLHFTWNVLYMLPVVAVRSSFDDSAIYAIRYVTA